MNQEPMANPPINQAAPAKNNTPYLIVIIVEMLLIIAGGVAIIFLLSHKEPTTAVTTPDQTAEEEETPKPEAIYSFDDIADGFSVLNGTIDFKTPEGYSLSTISFNSSKASISVVDDDWSSIFIAIEKSDQTNADIANQCSGDCSIISRDDSKRLDIATLTVYNKSLYNIEYNVVLDGTDYVATISGMGRNESTASATMTLLKTFKGLLSTPAKNTDIYYILERIPHPLNLRMSPAAEYMVDFREKAFYTIYHNKSNGTEYMYAAIYDEAAAQCSYVVETIQKEQMIICKESETSDMTIFWDIRNKLFFAVAKYDGDNNYKTVNTLDNAKSTFTKLSNWK